MTRCPHCKPGDPCERHFQESVIDSAHVWGWRVAHFRPAQTSKGWRTPVAADGAGFPDLILIRGSELLALELKRKGGSMTVAQGEWIDAFRQVGQVTALCLSPVDWPMIEAALGHETERDP